MKQFVFLFLAFFSVFSYAQSKGAPKMLICMEAAYVAGEAFDRKAAGRKVEFPQASGDMIYDAFLKAAVITGRNAKTYQDAVEKANKQCVESKFWAELSR